MAKLNISQAAKLYGKDRSSIQRKIKQGELSISINGKGYKEIDLMELIRVFGEPSKLDTEETHVENDNVQQLNTVAATPFLHEKISMLEVRVEELVKERDREKGEYQQREEWLQRKIDQITLALPDYTQKKATSPQVLWAFLPVCMVISAMPLIVWFLLDFLKQ